MGDLRIEAQNILKAKQNKKRDRYIENSISENSNIREKKIKSMQKFQEKVQYQIDNFQNNLLESAKKGETLKIDIVELNKSNLISWWSEREEKNQELLEEYLPIKSSIVTFIDDINLDYLKDDIILDDTLQKLYDTIKDNDIYPDWRVKRDSSGEIKSIYLEANPLISYKERRDQLIREKENRSRALVVLEKPNSKKIEKVNDKQIIKKLIKSIFIFIGLLYFSVTILTIISNDLAIIENSNSNSFIEIAWPYFLFKDFSNVADMFIFSLPIGLIISIYFAYKKS